jgi:hypothetical protein
LKAGEVRTPPKLRAFEPSSALFLVALLLYLVATLEWVVLQNGGGGFSAAPFSRSG